MRVRLLHSVRSIHTLLKRRDNITQEFSCGERWIASDCRLCIYAVRFTTCGRWFKQNSAYEQVSHTETGMSKSFRARPVSDKAWGSDRNVVIPELLQTGMTKIVGRSPIYRKPPDHELHTHLTPLQYSVTQEEGTERPFNNEF
jgi:hypothetical protein